jgi:hypothetical protein
MAIPLNENWLDQNASRSFPLVDGVTRLDTTAAFQLPNDLLVDLRIAAPVSLDATKWFVSKVSAFGSGLVITIAVNAVADVATITIPLVGFVEFSDYTVVGLPGYTQVGGVAAIGSAAAVLAASSGVYNFVLASTQILPTVIYPAAPSVSSITVIDALGGSTPLTGAVVLAAGLNGSISVASQTITLDIESAVLINDPCACTDTGGRLRTSIKSINGVTPDTFGNIDLVPVGCVQIETATAQLKLKDSCAQPCCGTPELQTLADNAKNLDQFTADLAGRIADLESSVRAVTSYLVQ